MRKKPIRIILLSILFVLVAIGVYFGKQYYEDRYVGTPYYAMVPAGYNIQPEIKYGMDDVNMGPGVDFILTAYNAAGEARTCEFTVYVPEDSTKPKEPMPQPGDFLEISASKTIVVGWEFTTEASIPSGALGKLR